MLHDPTTTTTHPPIHPRTHPRVQGLTEIVVTSADQVLAAMRTGESRRHFAQTKMNHESSRSHTVFKVCLACGCVPVLASFRGCRLMLQHEGHILIPLS